MLGELRLISFFMNSFKRPRLLNERLGVSSAKDTLMFVVFLIRDGSSSSSSVESRGSSRCYRSLGYMPCYCREEDMMVGVATFVSGIRIYEASVNGKFKLSA